MRELMTDRVRGSKLSRISNQAKQTLTPAMYVNLNFIGEVDS